MSGPRELDLVLWGATGFVGRRVAHHLAQRIADGEPLRLGLGARRLDELEALRATLPEAARELPLLVGDAFDRASLEAMAKRTRVVCSVVGPYASYGNELVEVCVQSGTDYCDITGETHWMRQMIDAHQADAARTGARLIFTCGFDSVPSDIGVMALQRDAMARTGEPCPRVRMRVERMRGGLNGGTAASLLNRNANGMDAATIRRLRNDPYSLNPPGERHGPDQPTNVAKLTATRDHGLSAWTVPFVMAPINTKVVRRTNALLGYPYGRGFRYDEAMLAGQGVRGWIAASLGSLGSGLFLRALGPSSTRKMISRVLPKPGEGPDEQTRRTGGFELLFIGDLANGEEARLRVSGDGDPNTESTSKLTAESALCLAQDDIDVGGGFWTPASALGEKLLDRLLAHGVLRFERLDAAGASAPWVAPESARSPERASP